MGVDIYHCEKCDECLHCDCFPRCFVCGDYDECDECVNEECLITGKKGSMKLCDDCINKDFEQIKHGAKNYHYTDYGITLKQIKRNINERKK